jgi:HisA/HisF family protein
MGGRVVHARLGDRANYRPIRSTLCDCARPEAVVTALLGLFGFRRLYVADLDALLGRPPQLATIDAVRRIAPHLSLWIDAGVRDRADLAAIAARGTPVLASELLAAAAVEPLLEACPEAVLSIDYRGDRFLGEPAWLEHLSRRAADVIAINLAHVGSGLGPDVQLIERLRALAPGSRLYVGGGVRDLSDLRRCGNAGAAGALIATALHDGRIGRDELTRAHGRSGKVNAL